MRSFFKWPLLSLVTALAMVSCTTAPTASRPTRHAPLTIEARPAGDYESARARAAALLANPPPEVRPECRSTILDHGRRTRDVYVLLHGLTNCPMQFRKFADQLYKRGANVVMLRLPYHGFSDRMTPEQALLTARDIVESADTSVDLARGYGERIIVIGLSISGVSAAWLAQTRTDIDLAVVIAPFLAPNGVPDFADRPLASTLLHLPNFFVWWDAKQKENLAGSPVSYPRFSSRSIGETMSLGLDLFARAKASPPGTRKILLITSPADTAISMSRVQELEGLWKDHVTRKSFPAEWKVPHDCIDPAQPGAQVGHVYPQLIEWMDVQLR